MGVITLYLLEYPIFNLSDSFAYLTTEGFWTLVLFSFLGVAMVFTLEIVCLAAFQFGRFLQSKFMKGKK